MTKKIKISQLPLIDSGSMTNESLFHILLKETGSSFHKGSTIQASEFIGWFNDSGFSSSYAITASYSEKAGQAGSVDWSNVTGKPLTFPPTSHLQPWTTVVGVQTKPFLSPTGIPITASYAISASYAENITTQDTASYAFSASDATRAFYSELAAVSLDSLNSTSSSFSTFAVTASFALNSNSSGSVSFVFPAPTSSNSSVGINGDFSYDGLHFYVKSASLWKRTSLSLF